MAMASFVGVRVAGQLTWVPAHTSNGKKVNSRVKIPVYLNSNKGTNAKTGEKGRTDAFTLVAWGKLADVCCRSLAKGKAVDVYAEPQSYEGKLFNMDGSLRLDAAGQPITTSKVSFTVFKLIFAEESEKQIQQEIQTGRRPAMWDKPNHSDYQLWIDILHRKQATVWDGRSPVFENARVIIPQGPGIQLDFTQMGNAGYNTGAAPVYGSVNPNMGRPAERPVFVQDANGQFVQVNGGTLPGMVDYAVNTNPAGRPEYHRGPAPVYGAPNGPAPVHGYSAPNGGPLY
jgi:hypothetical protein